MELKRKSCLAVLFLIVWVLLSPCLTILFVVPLAYAQDASVPSVKRGFAGEWSDGTSWLTIIKEGDKFSAVYPSGKDVEVLRGGLTTANQLRLVNVNYGKLVNPFESYQGNFDKEAWIELGTDGTFLTVRFSRARGGQPLVMKRIAGNVAPAISEPATVNSAVASISAGTSYTCEVTTSGTGYCWGDGNGANGNGTTAGSAVPIAIVGGLNVASVSAGYYFTCWLTTSGAAYCSGNNGSGQLGNGTPRVETERGWVYNDSSVPTTVAGGLRFSLVSVGKEHACGLTTSGAAYCWGDNSYRQLGSRMGGERIGQDDQFSDSASPVPIAVGGGLRFATLSAGAAHTCAVTTDGTAYCWGAGGSGQLGNGTRRGSALPVAVTGGLNFTSVTTSKTENFTCGLTTSGTAYCWGLVDDNDNHQLGNSTTASSQVPVAVGGGLTFTALSAGALHVCGLTISGAAYCWGRGSYGELGTGTNKDALTPVPVTGALKFASISSGDLYTCGVTTSGAVYCWGASGGDDLSGNRARSLVPVAVLPIQTDEGGFEAFFREFSSAVRRRDRATLELMLSPTLEFPVQITSPNMVFDYLGYNNGEGWKQLEESITSGTRPYKDTSPQPITRVTNDKWVLFARGSDGKWRWLRFGIPSFF